VLPEPVRDLTSAPAGDEPRMPVAVKRTSETGMRKALARVVIEPLASRQHHERAGFGANLVQPRQRIARNAARVAPARSPMATGEKHAVDVEKENTDFRFSESNQSAISHGP